ncbi:2-oxo acid dehydrogenase subunit E2 [Roseibium aggregatum]|uniref:2-oxo acid dehydrogenase subunit E2 n=1 Tax=Roseibium aggregatum TaxID=187304 RepID=UPI001E61EED0|nr:2-oxo acid dehydrogenase subunit E2 [Roseibium aggregatum]
MTGRIGRRFHDRYQPLPTTFPPAVSSPEVAILRITRTEVAPVWDGEAFQPVQMVPLDLSYDNRVINGADAARFLSYYAGLLKEPRRMMM